MLWNVHEAGYAFLRGKKQFIIMLKDLTNSSILQAFIRIQTFNPLTLETPSVKHRCLLLFPEMHSYELSFKKKKHWFFFLV